VSKQKLKIAFVLDDGMDRQAGVQHYMLTLSAWYQSLGHEVHYIVGETENQAIPNLHVMSRNFKTYFNGNRVSTPLPASRQKIKSLLVREQFDMLHIQVPYSPFMAAKVINLAPKQTVIIGTFHIMPYGWVQVVGNWLLGLSLRRSLRKFDAMFAVSSAAQRFARQSFRVKSEILPNPINYQKYHAKRHKPVFGKPCQLLFIGRLVPRKGCFELLRALTYLQEHSLSTRPWQLHICSDGPQRQALTQYVSDHGLSQHVTFEGHISDTQKIHLLQTADIAIFPSLGGESFGIVLTEALAAGSAIVLGGNNPGYQTVLEAFPESLFDPKNKAAFAQILARYMNDQTAWSNLFQKQQQVGDLYDVSRVGQHLLDITAVAMQTKINHNTA
jgi:phosphatidylinositol alpha-mannosyltransferase